MNPDTLAIIAGMVVQTFGFIGALWRMSLRWEHRLTEVETIVKGMPKRHGDVVS